MLNRDPETKSSPATAVAAALRSCLESLLLPVSDLSGIFRGIYRRPVLRLLVLILFSPVFLLHQAATGLFLLLDEWLFPGYKDVKIPDAVFVLGPPRSGTTFLHRELAAAFPEFVTAGAWELFLAPSLCQKKIWTGILSMDRRMGSWLRKGFFFMETKLTRAFSETHPGSLRDPEEDYYYLSPMLACTGWMLFFPCWKGFLRYLPGREAASQSRRRNALEFYRKSLQKHLFFHGSDRRLLSKNASFSSWTDLLPEYFPGAVWVICMRSPLETVPSMLSTANRAMQGFAADLRNPGTMHDCLISSMQAHYQTLHKYAPVYSRAVIVDNKDLKTNMSSVLTFLEKALELEKARGRTRDTALPSADKPHSSAHSYSLEEFGLDPEILRSSCPVLPGTRTDPEPE